ncbi:MAG: hypothetical protein MJ212_02275 [Alphaproteobacteria bacterium]|nr:hypothetical protein [Alphaproteobacteria bacterium]
MKKIYAQIIVLLSCLTAFNAGATITAQTSTAEKVDTRNHELVKVEVIAEYRDKGYTGVIDLGTYNKVDDEKALEYLNNRFDGYKKNNTPGGCTSYIKKIVNDKNENIVILGRNMDLPNSLYPAYVLKIDEPGKYKSINIGYTGNGLETFEQIVEDGKIIKDMYDILPYMVTDTLNEKGLMIETNMRNATDKVVMTGTNPGKLRIPNLTVSRYLSDHAANIEEALKLLDNLDVYTPDSLYTKWHGALAMVDATGRFGVLEFVDNKPVWHEGQKGQTNYWLDKGAYEKTDSNVGMGRYQTMVDNDEKIISHESMHEAIKNVWYSQLFAVDTDKIAFDSCSEEVGATIQDELDKIKSWQQQHNIKIDEKEWNEVQEFAKEWKDPIPSSFCSDAEKKAKVDALTNLITHSFQQLPAAAKQTSGLQEVSDISYVIDNKENVYHVRFFEQPEVFNYSFDGIVKE